MMIGSWKRLASHWRAWRAVDDGRAGPGDIPPEIARLDELLHDGARAEARRRTPALRAIVMTRVAAHGAATPLRPHRPLPRMLGPALLAAAACCAVTAGWWWAAHRPVAGVRPARVTLAESRAPDSPRPLSPFELAGRARPGRSFAALGGAVDGALRQEARLLAADLNRAANFVRSQLPLARGGEPSRGHRRG